MLTRITSEDIKKLSTKRLLEVYRNERFLYSFYSPYESYDSYEEEEEAQEKFVEELKKELDTREHVPNKIEAKKVRQLAAKKNKGGRRSHKKK